LIKTNKISEIRNKSSFEGGRGMLRIFIKTKIVFIFLLFSCNQYLFSQQFIPLWPEEKMPNSKGVIVKDSISDERYRQVGIPGMLAFFTSKQENKNVGVIICPGGGYKHYAYEVSGCFFVCICLIFFRWC